MAYLTRLVSTVRGQFGIWYRRLPPLAAGLSVFLGLLVMVAWHHHILAIIQWPSGSPPIRYNTAIMLVLMGLALMACLGKRHNLALGLSSLVLLISGFTLGQYILGVDLGIDQLLMQDYITTGLYAPGQSNPQGFQSPIEQFFIRVEQPFPGRPSPNTTVSFLGLGVAILGLASLGRRSRPTAQRSSPWENRVEAIVAILAAGVIGMGCITLLGYITRLGTAYTWRYLTGMAIPIAMILSAQGLGLLLVVVHRRPRHRQPQWLLTSVGVGIGTASLLLWQALASWGHSLQGQLPSRLAAQVNSLLLPAANLVFITGLLVALLVVTVLHLYQRAHDQAQQLERINQDLEQARSLLETILESTADGILVLDTNWQVVHFNHRFIKILGIPPDLVNAVRSGSSEPNFLSFILEQVKDRETFLALTQQMLKHWEQSTVDVIEFKNGHVMERYGRPHRIGDRIVGKVLNYRDVTERYRAEAALRDSEDRYRSVVAALGEGIVLQDATGAIQTCNARAEAILGLSLDQLQGRTSIDPRWRSIHEDETPFPGDQHPAMVSLRTGQPCHNIIMGIHQPKGNLVWISINAQPMVRPGETQPYAVVTSFADITQRRQMEAALFHEKELAQVTLHSIGDAVITTDVNGCVEYCNPVAEMLTGWSQTDIQGRPLNSIFNIVHEETRDPVPNPVDIALAENRIVALERNTLLLSRDGREIGIDDSAAPIRDRRGHTVGAVMVFHDVTEARQLNRQVSWQAIHDPLTGLVNRHEFEQRLAVALAEAQTQDTTHVLCYLDLDQFKIVNDTCGHSAGDELLRQVTDLLQAHIRKTDTLARLGGDEFGVLLKQCDLVQAQRVANLLRETIQDFRFGWDGRTFAIGVSIGLVPINRQSDTLGHVLIAADSACYTAKNNGRNRVHTFQSDDQTLLQHQGEILWVSRLTEALEDNQFCLFVQPIIPTHPQPGAVNHYEVLIRLRDELGGMIPPMAFLPAAERYGLMVKIDRWVISTLFQHWAELQAPPGESEVQQRPIYAINLSGATINDEEMIDFLHQQFAQYAVPPDRVCFEITETVAITNLFKASQFIRQFRALGCRFALDDFGSGMSSFTYLKNLPIDYLKIDGSFVKDILNDPVDEAMVKSISHIGQVIGIKTIAEYVENSAILERITTLGVDFAQGYGMGYPQPLVYNPPNY